MRILYFLSLLIIVLSAVQKGEAWKRSTLYIGADDVLTNLYVNDNEIDLSDVDDLSTYSIVKKVDLALLIILKNSYAIHLLSSLIIHYSKSA